jgi:L-seryl-tRNA(Ser) seleniumtransferase
MRALRPDKLTLAALCATLALYRDGREAEVPAIAMLAAEREALRARAERLAAAIASAGVTVEPCTSTVGGGAMPLAELPSWGVAIAGDLDGRSLDALDARLRAAPVPVIGRVEGGRLWLDVRTVGDGDLDAIAAAVR